MVIRFIHVVMRKVQPGNTYNFVEENPELNAIVASLSTAGVAIGDKIGLTNKTLVMQTWYLSFLSNSSSMLDGTLLRTVKPATAIDRLYSSALTRTDHSYSMEDLTVRSGAHILSLNPRPMQSTFTMYWQPT